MSNPVPAPESASKRHADPVARFESRLATKCGGSAQSAVACRDRASAITATLLALGVRGRVVLSALAPAELGHAILAAGCTPAFVDVSPRTWEADPNEVDARLLEGDVGAVVSWRPFGIVRELTTLRAVTSEHRVPLIVDSGSSLPGPGGAAPAGSGAGDAVVISLSRSTHVIDSPSDDVAALLVNEQLEDWVRCALRGGRFEGDVILQSVGGMLSDLHAELACSLLATWEEDAQRRHAIAARYRADLGFEPAVATCPAPESSSWPSWPLLLRTADDAESLVTTATAAGLRLAHLPTALHRTSLFARFGGAALPVTDDLASRIVCLPVDPTEGDEGRTRLLDAAKGVLRVPAR